MTKCQYEFPCSIGEEVWCVKPTMQPVKGYIVEYGVNLDLTHKIQKETVDRFVVHSGGIFIVTESGVYLRSEVFASKQEAEQALREMKADG